MKLIYYVFFVLFFGLKLSYDIVSKIFQVVGLILLVLFKFCYKIESNKGNNTYNNQLNISNLITIPT